MHFAETLDQQRAWIKQWRRAEIALREVKREEMAAMTDDEAISAFNALDMPPELIWRSPDRANSAGLIEQQRLFKKAHSH
jgi:hypothetical protein